MEQYRAIPPGYWTVGEVAKKMGITVRTLQYYDQEKLLCPSAVSEGGRRLYTDKDFVKLHQILSLKSLGFSLDDIKKRLMPLDTPEEVAQVLEDQAMEIRQKIKALSESQKEIEMLREEVLRMQSVNFKKYADIIVNLQMKNEFYWLIKYFDDQMMDYIRKRFDKESGQRFMKQFNDLSDKILQFQKEGIPPESSTAQELAGAFWEMVMDFTNGDQSMLPKLMEIGGMEKGDESWKEKQEAVNSYIGKALEIYFQKMGINPFGEEKP